MEQDPSRPGGYYYFCLNVGIYSDGVSKFIAIMEGLKNKTQLCFEKVYKLDKVYDNIGAILARGRYWALLPGPFKDEKKALSIIGSIRRSSISTTVTRDHYI
jgi:hypothetical protein